MSFEVLDKQSAEENASRTRKVQALRTRVCKKSHCLQGTKRTKEALNRKEPFKAHTSTRPTHLSVHPDPVFVTALPFFTV